MAATIVEWFGSGSGSHCGYCKSDDTSLSHGMWAHDMSCQTYIDLLDRGWRRSGNYCYKPMMDKTCCPQYTIRCDVTQLKLSKSQKKVLKRINKFLLTGAQPTENSGEAASSIMVDCKEVIDPGCNIPTKNISVVTCEINKSDIPVKSDAKNNDPLSGGSSVKGADPNKPKCRKAKEVRKEKKMLKLSKKLETGVNTIPVKSSAKNVEKSIEDFIEDLPLEALHKLETVLIPVFNSELFTDAVFQSEFQLYSKYQRIIHGDKKEDISEMGFRRFLVDGPLQPVEAADSNSVPSIGLGAFHQQYLLDGKLIAVGVLDILPHAVSSKYFIYDPDYSFLSLGTYSALREIYLIRSLCRQSPALKYYYMGYFIESCPKMRYKANYYPSYLLCPETYIWQPVGSCLPKFATKKYSKLEEDNDKKPPPPPDIKTMQVLKKNQAIPYSMFMASLSRQNRKIQELEIQEYCTLVGPTCSNILLYRR